MIPDRESRDALKSEAQSRIDAATRDLASGAIEGAEWQRRVAAALASAYLRSDDPRWQSGFDGDAALWREARGVVLDAVPYDGSLLDVGCATGHLMESLEAWARERQLRVAAYGLDIDPELATEARRRLPAFANRIFTGNVTQWSPPHRFTYVRTGLEYVPAGEASLLLRRLMTEFVEPGGRVIVGPVNESALEETCQAFRDAGAEGTVVASSPDRNGKVRYVVWGRGR